MSSISAETAARSENDRADNVVDQQSHAPPTEAIALPSETTQPSQTDEAPQQGATQPGSGSTVPADSAESETTQPRFKEKVIGYAKEFRGTTMRKSSTKEQGQRIVSGEEKFDPKKVGPKS